MTEHPEDRPDETQHAATCRVCLKPMEARAQT